MSQLLLAALTNDIYPSVMSATCYPSWWPWPPWRRRKIPLSLLVKRCSIRTNNWAAVVEELRAFLGLELDAAAMVNAVDPTLYRERVTHNN